MLKILAMSAAMKYLPTIFVFPQAKLKYATPCCMHNTQALLDTFTKCYCNTVFRDLPSGGITSTNARQDDNVIVRILDNYPL